MVITLDFESSDPGSSPGRTSFLQFLLTDTSKGKKVVTVGIEPTTDGLLDRRSAI